MERRRLLSGQRSAVPILIGSRAFFRVLLHHTVEPTGKGGLSFDCSVVTLGQMAFISAAYEGEMRNRRHARSDKLLIVFPRQGIALER